MTQTIDLTTPTGVELKFSLAGAGSRAYAYIIDWHIRILVVLLWIFGWTQIYGPGALGSVENSGRSGVLWLTVFPGLFYSLYHPVVELIMNGNSPGKNFAKIAVVNRQGEAPSPGQVLLRNFIRLIDSLPAFYTVGTISIVVTDQHVRLGDMAANTRVINVADNSADTLEKLNQIEQASIDNKDAEFIQQLLERWSALSAEKRGELAGTILQRHNIVPEYSQVRLKAQLQSLLTP